MVEVARNPTDRVESTLVVLALVGGVARGQACACDLVWKAAGVAEQQDPAVWSTDDVRVALLDETSATTFAAHD